MSREETLRMGRLAREREAMSSTCRIERREPDRWNRATGLNERGDSTVIYAGRCELTAVNAQRVTDLGEGERAVSAYRVALPWSDPTAHEVHATDVVVMNSRTLYVDSVPRSDTDTAVYLNVSEQTHG